MLTNVEFENIMNIDKIFVKNNIKMCTANENITYDLISINNTEKFILDVDRRGFLELNKIKIQNRFKKIPLVRLEINCPPHMNPDRTKTSRNHIHIYREGYDLKWAFDLDSFNEIYFKDIRIFSNIFIDFCNFCKIKLNNFQGVI